MNDKQKLAAMGEHLAEQRPLCMAKRIEELEAQVRAMAELLRDARKYVTALGKPDDEVSAVQMTVSRIDALLAGKLPEPVVPEGWQLVPVDPIKCIDMGWAYLDAARDDNPDRDWAFSHAGYAAMLAAAPKPEAK